MNKLLLVILLPACSLTPAQRTSVGNQVLSNMASSTSAGLLGFLAGGRAGAVTAVLQQEAVNLPKLRAAALGKNPVNVQP